jgi:hypothetical protein
MSNILVLAVTAACFGLAFVLERLVERLLPGRRRR